MELIDKFFDSCYFLMRKQKLILPFFIWKEKSVLLSPFERFYYENRGDCEIAKD
jgi:hypothetical protein